MKLRTVVLGAMLILAGIAGAQQSPDLGTKKDFTTAHVDSAPIVDGWQLAQMLVALTIVFCLVKFGLPKLLGRMGNRFVTSENCTISVRESVSCGASTLQVIDVRGRSLLIAVSPQSVSFLTDLTPVQQGDSPAFFELVDAKMGAPENESVPQGSPAMAVVEPRREDSEYLRRPLAGTKAEAHQQEISDETEYEASLELLMQARKRMETRTAVGAPVNAATDRSDRLRRLVG